MKYSVKPAKCVATVNCNVVDVNVLKRCATVEMSLVMDGEIIETKTRFFGYSYATRNYYMSTPIETFGLDGYKWSLQGYHGYDDIVPLALAGENFVMEVWEDTKLS